MSSAQPTATTHDSHATHMPSTPSRPHTLRAPAATRGGLAPRAANTVEHRAQLARRITMRDRWIIAMLHEHRVLTSTQIALLAFPSYRVAMKRLQLLHLWSVIDRFHPHRTYGTAPLHYVLGPVGAHMLAQQHGHEPDALGYRRERALGICTNLFLAHTVGIADWFTALIHAADRTTQTSPPTRITSWWSEKRCAAHFGDLVRPDAYGRLTSEHGPTDFFLEYDNGTENPVRLGHKLAGYHRLAQATGIPTPVLVWFTNPGREPAARHHLTRARQALDHTDLVPVATATAESGPDPLSPLWLPLHHHQRHAITRIGHAWTRRDEPSSPARSTGAASTNADAAPTALRLPAPPPRPPAASDQ